MDMLHSFGRRDFLGGLAAAGAAFALSGCKCPFGGSRPQIALQLYSIREYIGKVGIERALEDIARIGYRGVELVGFYGKSPKELKRVLDANGLVAVGAHVGQYPVFEGDKLARLAEQHLACGNHNLICQNGCMPKAEPGKPRAWSEDHLKYITDYFNERSVAAAKLGCRIGYHNHRWELMFKDPQGETFWDRFFDRTVPAVIMEQDVGWTVAAGYDPCAIFCRHPNCSPVLHAKENGVGPGVKSFDGILGQPGKPGAVPVDWDSLVPLTEANGTEWYIVECECHPDDLSAVKPSYDFLKAKGL